MQDILGTQNLITNAGELKISELSSYSVIGLYFTAHWCPPCRTFTPKLISLYKAANSSQKVIEIIFISFDRDSETMNNYFEEMPWAAIPFSDANLREGIGHRFSITGIPALIVFKPNGTLISEDGRSDVYSKNAAVIDYWIKGGENPNQEKNGEASLGIQDNEIEVSDFPTDPLEGLVCDRNHYLIWQGDVGKYYHETTGSALINCGYCKAVLKRSSWHCRECKFDLCKDCRDWVIESKNYNNPYLKCWSLHSLLMSEKLKEYYLKKIGSDKYTCRSCNNALTGLNLHCRRCYFDMCLDCQRTVETCAPQASKAKCNGGHNLVWTPELSKLYYQKFKVAKYKCDVCTRSYSGAGSFSCLSCGYDVCIFCINPMIQS
jgi:thiol-disulfide isomerase/thioredoxin